MAPRFRRGVERRWMLVNDFVWRVGGPNVAVQVTIKAGRQFESSVPPWIPKWIMDQDDPRFLTAALVHDYLLENHYGRAQAAAEWYDGARFGGAPKLKAKLAYIGVAAWAVLKPAQSE